MSVMSNRYVNIVSMLAAACILAACTTTTIDRKGELSTRTVSPTQVEPEAEPVEVIDKQKDEAETLQFEPQTQISPPPTPSEGEFATAESAQTNGVEEVAEFPEQRYQSDEPLVIESESDAEINRLREQIAASEAELELSRSREAESERSRALEAELERNRALEAELERSRALEAEAERSRALEAEQVRSRALEAELERIRAQQEEAERSRALEAELERSRALEAESERIRALQAEAERERIRALEAEAERERIRAQQAEAERERGLIDEPDTDFASEQPGSTYADSDEMEADPGEQDSGLPEYTAMAQASDDDPEPGPSGRTTFPPGKPVEYSIYFAYNQASLELEVETTLVKHAEYLRANPELRAEIQGNCDERGSREYNIALGARRAQAVKRALELLGVDGQRIDTLSFGAEKPIAFGHDEESWRMNRRADIVY